MSQDSQHEENNPEMTLEEKMEYENYLVEQAFENTYRVVTNRSSFEDLMTKQDRYGIKAIMIFDPSEDPDEALYDDLICYYEGLEEYERCGELLGIKNKVFKDV
jgi:hypothetical protein